MNAPVKPSKLIKGATGDWEMVIGLEIHAQVTSNSKLFSGASTEFGGAPNDHVSLVDAAMPGMLPVINEECVAQAIRSGLGLKAQINLKSTFDRKNYFYPDLPQGYQISQYKSPIVGEGDCRTCAVSTDRVEPLAGHYDVITSRASPRSPTSLPGPAPPWRRMACGWRSRAPSGRRKSPRCRLRWRCFTWNSCASPISRANAASSG